MVRLTARRGTALLVTAAAGPLAIATALAPTGAASVAAARPTNHQYVEMTSHGVMPQIGNAGDESQEAAAAAEQFQQARLAPWGSVPAGEYTQAYNAMTAMSPNGSQWAEVTTQPYDQDAFNYRDANFSNSSGGAGLVAGRITGLAVGRGFLYAGGANGGIFRRPVDLSTPWTPISDSLPTLSVGDLKFVPGATAADDALWLATGEANTGAESYVGTGVYRLQNPSGSQFAPGDRVGGTELESRTINKIEFDDSTHTVYAATSRGLWRHSATSTSGAWTLLLMPNPQDDVNIAKPYNNIVNDVAIQPGSDGKRVLADVGWRSGAAYNGFYLSTDGGANFTRINPSGAINGNDIGNGEFAYSQDGKKLYVVLESPHALIHSPQTVLDGVYVSPNGSVTGPWNKIADAGKLGNQSSALQASNGYHPGVQAWYNNFITVDPTDANHVIVGLEEVYETRNGGSNWTTIGPYWNFGFKCWNINAENYDPPNCPLAPHSDQHSVAMDMTAHSGKGQLYVGNDGGVYTRPLNGGHLNTNGNATDWVSLNSGLGTLQYYSVGVGKEVVGGNPTGQYYVAGGLQDNGGSLLRTGWSTMVEPFGGDGGDIIVDPNNGCRILDEYVYLTLWMTKTCGYTDATNHRSVIDVSVPDPAPRFTAPFRADSVTGHWVAGGRYVWTNTNTWSSTGDGTDWTSVYDTGTGHMVVGLESQNGVIYASWCGNTNCNSSGFTRGIASNVGGTWHQLNMSSGSLTLPNRYPSNVVIDPRDSAGKTIYAVFNGFNRRFIEGPGATDVVGHVFKGVIGNDGMATWTDVSGNLPNVPASDLVVLANGHMVLGTDWGAFVTADGGATWERVGDDAGHNLPLTVVNDLHIGVDGNLYAATYGRGIWKTPIAGL